MDTNKPIIILGAGASIPFLNSQHYRTGCGLPLKLEEIIRYNYSIGLNHFFQFGCKTTFVSFVDSGFYEDNYNEISKLPLVLGQRSPVLQRHNHDIAHPNTILLKKSNAYKGLESFTEGIYTVHLVGIWALTVAITLGFKEIYLLGYDCCVVNGQTHFYQGVVDLKRKTDLCVRNKKVGERLFYRGIGKKQTKKGERFRTSTYNRPENLNNQWFEPFKDLKDIKIYNVSPESKIELFEKIDYDSFYSKVTNNHVDQNEARSDIKRIIYNQLKEQEK